MKILAVDDNLDNVDLICDLLEDDYDLIKAYNGSDCIKLAREEQPDLILLDVQMPKMNGYEVLLKLKEDKDTYEIPVIFLSAHYRDTDRIVKGLETGAFDYLTKPIEDELLRAKVNVVARVLEAEAEVKRQREHLARANKELEEANRIKSDFLAVMSHEIRTPINGILGYADLLARTSVNEDQEEYVKIIKTSGNNLLELINNILDFSKIESLGVDLENAPFKLEDTVVEALNVVLIRANEKGISLNFNISDQSPDGVFVGDSHRLRQIILNLVNNAVKFTKKGEVLVNVKTTPCEANKWEIYIGVKDTGIGIPEDKRDRLFKPFSQVDSSTTRRFGGSGLGLVICKRIAEKMEGRLWVDSSEGEGSHFHFTAAFDGAPMD